MRTKDWIIHKLGGYTKQDMVYEAAATTYTMFDPTGDDPLCRKRDCKELDDILLRMAQRLLKDGCVRVDKIGSPMLYTRAVKVSINALRIEEPEVQK